MYSRYTQPKKAIISLGFVLTILFASACTAEKVAVTIETDVVTVASSPTVTVPTPTVTSTITDLGPPSLFILPRAGGGEVSLANLIGTKPLVVVFYRGFF